MRNNFMAVAARQSDARLSGAIHGRFAGSRCKGVIGRLVVGLMLPVLFSLRPSAQGYVVDWYKIAGGGGTSTNASYSVSGTIGQSDASSAMTGGNYSLIGGYWSLINVAQAPGAPTLYISHRGNTVTVYWQNITGWSLYQSGNLATPAGSWSASTNPALANGTNYLSLVNPSGSLFFRLNSP